MKGLGRLLLLLPEKLFDGVAHAVGFAGGLGFGLDSEPSVPAWSFANVFHASSNIPYDERGREPSGQPMHYQRRTACRQGQVRTPIDHYSSIFRLRCPAVTLFAIFNDPGISAAGSYDARRVGVGPFPPQRDQRGHDRRAEKKPQYPKALQSA